MIYRSLERGEKGKTYTVEEIKVLTLISKAQNSKQLQKGRPEGRS